jgi:hypothetical protein
MRYRRKRYMPPFFSTQVLHALNGWFDSSAFRMAALTHAALD